ncbi:tRNA N6-adenosine threonylcarbamoyltransferase, mitochondrial-like isoform X2 [Styela clava]
MLEHKITGGVHPVTAMKLHEVNLPLVVDDVMDKAGIDFQDLSAVATATQPGSALSLQAGLIFSKQLVAKHRLPFIPVHHMEAHALTVRSIEEVNFPFLVLLASGGHCLLCLAQNLGNYKILGQILDEPPGAVFDKVAREIVKYLPPEYCSTTSGGRIIEALAKKGDSLKHPFSIPLTGHTKTVRSRSCNFSFSGLQSQVLRKIAILRERNELDIVTCQDVAASFQKAAIQHITNQLHRGIIFCQIRNLSQPSPILVLSGGVAANSCLRESVLNICNKMNTKLICPPIHLCTDNGIMIAWAGMEYLKQGIGISEDPENVRYEPRSPLGDYIGNEIIKENIKLPKVKVSWKRHI